MTYIRNKVFLIISEVISCADYRLTKIADKTIMVENGWIFDPDLLHQIDFDDQCGNDTYYGYQNGKEVASVYTTFDGNGVASLIFTNCYNGSATDGYVSASIKSKEIGRAYKNAEVNVSFNFSNDDSLIIKIVGRSIFKLKYFMTDACGKYDSFTKLLCVRY